MNRNPRNASLLAQLAETNPFKAELVHRLFKIGNDFEKAVADVGADGRLSAQGKRERAQGLVEKAMRELDDAQRPIVGYLQQTASLRAEMKTPTFDKADISAAMLRREFRDRSVSMSFGQKAALMSGKNRSADFIDAVCFEQAAWVSGFDLHNPNEAELYEEARQSRLREINGDLMTALEARASVEAEILMIVNVVRGDIEADAAQLASRAA
jgi:hypothetical protein